MHTFLKQSQKSIFFNLKKNIVHTGPPGSPVSPFLPFLPRFPLLPLGPM